MVWMKILQINCDIHRKTASAASIFIGIGSPKEEEVTTVLTPVKRKGITYLPCPWWTAQEAQGLNHSKRGRGTDTRKNITMIWIAGIDTKEDWGISPARGFRRSGKTNTSQMYCTQSVLSQGWSTGQLISWGPFSPLFTLILTLLYKRMTSVFQDIP